MMFRTLYLSIGWTCLLSATAGAASWYVAPDGDDAFVGSLDKPFATVQRAQQAAAPGDTVFIRGGVYSVKEEQLAKKRGLYAEATALDKSGKPDAPIRYWAFPGEQPIFDMTNVKPAGQRIAAFH